MIIIKQFLTVIAAALMMISTVYAKPLNAIQIQQLAESYLKSRRVDENISGVAITIYSNENKKFISGYAGTIAYNHDITINSESLFQIGSITKSFIAAILLKLEDDHTNKFSLDDPIDKYFIGYQKWHAITVRQLMNMTSGIPDCFADKTILDEYSKHPHKQHNIKNWIDHIYKKPLLFKPGAQFNYSNTNYFLLGLLIEKITGHSLEHAFRHFITTPLNLNHTYFVSHQPNSSLYPYLVHGYQYERVFSNYIPLGTDVTHYSLSYMYAAGSIISTSTDVAKWIQALFTPGKVLSKKQLNKLISVISEKTAQQTIILTSLDPNGYGLGISVYFNSQTQDIWFIYQGITFGFRAIYVYIPKRNILVSITVNSSFHEKNNHLFALTKQICRQLVS